jgi:hypothetical protein
VDDIRGGAGFDLAGCVTEFFEDFLDELGGAGTVVCMAWW